MKEKGAARSIILRKVSSMVISLVVGDIVTFTAEEVWAILLSPGLVIL